VCVTVPGHRIRAKGQAGFRDDVHPAFSVLFKGWQLYTNIRGREQLKKKVPHVERSLLQLIRVEKL